MRAQEPMTRIDIAALLRKAKARKSKRAAKRRTLYSGKPALPGRAIARGKLDGLWSMFVKLRDRRLHGPLCRVCGVRAGEVAYHVVPKQRGDAVRWEPENGVLACSPCNYGEMVRRADYRDKHVSLFGKALVEGLEEKARRGAKFSRADLAAMAEHLRLRIERLRSNATDQPTHGLRKGEGDSPEPREAQPGPRGHVLGGPDGGGGEGAEGSDELPADGGRGGAGQGSGSPPGDGAPEPVLEGQRVPEACGPAGERLADTGEGQGGDGVPGRGRE